jgi:hypothetical protein
MAAHGQPDLLSTALEIAEERAKMLDRIRALLEANKNDEAISVMKTYCGMTTDDKKGHRTSTRLN